MSRAFRLLVLSIFFLSAGCSSLAPLLVTPTPAPVEQATATPQIFSTTTALPDSQARILRVWLPARFDPNAETEAAALLKQRFTEFEAQHPGLEIEIRIKAETGETDLLNSLSITSAAAPTALPDLVALPRPALESAALKGFLHPMDGLSTALENVDWYGYARDMGHIQNIGYGLPFAGDAMALACHSGIENVENWQAVFRAKNTLAFAAGDPQGLFGLLLYISAGGELQDAGGLPSFDEEKLTQVLTWAADGVFVGSILPSLKNVVTSEDVKKTYDAGSVDMAVTWASIPPADGTLAPIPGLGDSMYAFGTGWVWSLAGSNPENQQLAIELAEYLTAVDFIKEWTLESGYLPVRPSSVVETDSVVASIAESAYMIPSDEELQVLGPLMQEALVRVLNGEQPEAVAGSVIEKLK